ncbi:hypothetical protein A2311_00200 [candidate division WOR-1 bacterium RIFOXYB2_FULL_48_7]|uniref:Aspartyl-tRNA amidotransferase n=1 Tax=candidate division WOR-1 bacterium RIFOXYB2_FULL_48_7 TaxID=1802583 RepID=A0A1F4TW34_UNCSA|nr:MAG: hypothetical protein A2311_00200 [candidate division WOR-1 bacterium RIFOXYB2_FULL_48_7]
MENLLTRINADLQAAMKSQAEFRLGVLRMMKSKILYVNARGDLPEAELVKIITKYSKELKDGIEEFRKVNRPDDVARIEKELQIVLEYLPKQLAPEEVKNLVTAVIASVGATSIKEMGKVMKEVTTRQPGIDGKLVNQFVRELLK